MKKFFVLLILIGGVAAAIYFYDPYIKPYLQPLIDQVAGKSADDDDDDVAGKEGSSEDTPDSGSVPKTPEMVKPAPAAPKPAVPAAPPKSEIDQIVEERYPIPEFVPLMQIVDNWNNIPPRAMPAEIAIQDKVPFSLRDSSGKVIGASVAAPGTLVKPVRIQGSNLIVASLVNQSMQSQVPLNRTDLKTRIEKRYNDFVLDYTIRIRQQREKAKQALMARPETLAALKESQGNTSFDAADDPRFAAVKASIKKGDVSGFGLGDLVGLRWNGSQKINGPIRKGTYDTVTVKYKVQTIFGAFPGEAKCLLQSGRVVGWVDPITEEDFG